METITQPPVIKYNLRNRGRNHTGKERNFNIKELCKSIMSEKTQERIRTRGMLGYFGHSPRIIGGMNPVESLVINGTYNEIEPAVITISLSCDADGNIEHKTEFLDTESGNKAARLFSNKVGGFSSVINENAHEFIGLDFVLDPNYSTNRGFSLDAAGLLLDDASDENDCYGNLAKALFDSVNEFGDLSKAMIDLKSENKLALESLNELKEDNENLSSLLSAAKSSLDSVTGKLQAQDIAIEDIIRAEYSDQLSGALALVDNLKAVNSLALDSLSNLQEENEELLALLSAKPVLDDLSNAPLSVSKSPAQQILDDMQFFKRSKLPSLSDQKPSSSADEDRFFKRLRNGY